jgi:tetratricopeptide (TPR) repeat protein
MTEHPLPRMKRTSVLLLLLLFCLFSLPACVSHLKEAKFYYAQGQQFSRQYQTQKAVASFKRALKEAELEAQKHPSAQAYMLKGLAEMELDAWKDAEESFLRAFSFGFEKGEEWAREVSLLGMASSLGELGLEDSAFKIYSYLVDKSKIKQISIGAAQKYMDIALERAIRKEGREREKLLGAALKTAEKLSARDLSCGFYHYLQSQVLSHLAEYKRSFEEAVMARELGLPTEEIFRDNDLQIVFCYKKLKEELSSAEEWQDFHSKYMKWIQKWNWPDPETPAWRKEAKRAADHKVG